MTSMQWRVAWVLACCAPLSALAASKCQLKQVAEVPVTMSSLRPLIDAKLNGKDAKFIIDSGAFYSMISAPTAAEYGLRTFPAPFGLQVVGIGGHTTPELTKVKEFTLLGVPFKDVQFLVGGSEVGYQGLLGQNLLQNFDVEYDLAHGKIRLFKTEDCGKSLLAYWVTQGQQFSSMRIEPIQPSNPHTIGTGRLNGHDIEITFDTGAFSSVLSTEAAARAGIRPDSPGVTEAGVETGIGRTRVHSYLATFGSLEIGDGEQIKNAKLRFSELFAHTDMLLGADFFISHRVFVGNREHRLFVTYNGGPVFDLSHPATAAAEGQGAAVPSEDASLTDPAELARRGSALAARRDFPPALADLTKAVELAPDNPEYFFQRANAYRASGEGDKALADLDRVIMLRHDFLPAYIPRAEMKLARHDREAALADLDTVRELAPRQADLRFLLAEIYQRLDRLPDAIEQYGVWIGSHPDDSRLVVARASRCLVSALQNQDLKTALEDCDYALRHIDKASANYSHLFVNRGLVRLRQGDDDHALADFNDAVRVSPDNVRALYGRAVAESRKHRSHDSEQDLAKAQKLGPAEISRLQSRGFTP